MESHSTWRSSATHRSVVAIVLAAFNPAEEMRDIANPLKGLKKPQSKPRLHSASPDDETELYGATEQCLSDFLSALWYESLTQGFEDVCSGASPSPIAARAFRVSPPGRRPAARAGLSRWR